MRVTAGHHFLSFLFYIIFVFLQGTGKEYPLRSVYTDEESCPIMEYKCKKAGGNGKAYWEKLNGDTMNGKNVAFSKHDIIDLHIFPLQNVQLRNLVAMQQ